MKKRFFALICLLLAGAMLLGACAGPGSKETATPGRASDIGDTFVIATVNGENIYYSEFYKRYSATCSQAGIAEDDPMYSEMIKNSVLEMLVQDEIMAQALAEKGYLDLSEEQLAKAHEDAQAEIDMSVDYYYGSTIDAELGTGYSDEERAKVYAKYEEMVLADYGMTKDDFYAFYIKMIAEEAAREDLTGNIVPTDAELKTKFDENVASDKEAMDEDASVYEQAVMSGRTIYYRPEGVRNVRQILFILDDESRDAVGLLRSSGYDTSADFLLQNALSQIKETAQEALNKLKSGALSFEEAMQQYNDPEKEKGTIYAVSEGSSSYVESFTSASMELENIGDFTQLVASDYGYHIIEYVSDVEAGAVAFDSVKDDVHEALITTLKDQKWQQIVDEWTAAAVVVYTDTVY